LEISSERSDISGVSVQDKARHIHTGDAKENRGAPARRILEGSAMSEDKKRKRPAITGLQVFKWSLPSLAGFVVNLIAMLLGWEPWFGYAAIIAGALGSLMYVGQSLGVGGDQP
jgi:Flp pilus assembly protein TadB